jgi:uncharacterized protein YhjY with autotransporter beta-barrel domain
MGMRGRNIYGAAYCALKTMWLLAPSLAVLMAGTGAVSAQSLLGDTVNVTANFPSQTTVAQNGGNQVVAPTANFSFFAPVIPQNITVGPTFIRLVDTTGSGYVADAFNGYVITDLTAARIRSATIDAATNFAGFNASRLSFTSNSVSLNLQSLEPNGAQQVVIDLSFFSLLTPLLPQGAPVNAVNVAGGIDNFSNNGGNLPPNFANLSNLSGFQLVNALTQLDGETSTDAERGAFQLMNQFLGLMLDPFVDGRFGPGGAIGFAPDREAAFPPDIALAYASVMKAPVYKAPPTSAWSVWGTAFGSGSHANGDPTIGSTDVGTRTYGFASGADYRVTPNTVVGFALAGAGTNWGLAQPLGAGRSDAFQAGVYAKTELGPVYLAGDLAFTNNWFTTNRLALGDQLTASFNGQSYGGRLEGGYRFIVPTAPNFEILPYAAVQAQSFHTPSYSETDLTGGGLGLNFNAMNATDTRSELGARFTDRTVIDSMPLILRARLAWAHDWVDNPALNAVFQVLPGSSFVVNGARIPSDSALASVGAELLITPHWSLSGKFDGEFAQSSQTYTGRGTLRYTW